MKNSASIVHAQLLSGERIQILLTKASEEGNNAVS